MFSSSISSSKVPRWMYEYDVFLSYHDEDIGRSFVSDLSSALTQDGYAVYINDHDLTSGERRNSAAIEESRTSIIIFSSKFDCSTWFLHQLEKILECGRTIKQVVVPVFYHVDPSDVQNQKGVFGEAFVDCIARGILTEDKSIRYRDALFEAAKISGFWMMNTRSQSKEINVIVEGLCHLIGDKQLLYNAKHPVGVEARVKDVIQLLNSEQAENTMIVGIWGMNGVGKTIIAKATYNQMSFTFDCKSFLYKVNETCESGDDGLVSFQRQLLLDICKTTKIHIDTVESGKKILQRSLCHKKVFLVLDGVNKLEQLNALCGSREWFGHGSRIVITTRDKHILRSLQVDHVYRMKYMDNTESLELFSWHAFKNPSPIESYTDLCRDVVEYCGGLPLALEVIGSYLFQRSVEEWKSILEKLKTIPHDHILNKLRTNLDGLDREDKYVFLKIAALFIGMHKDDVIQALKYSGYFTEIAISSLKDKSLVTIDSNNRIGMHTLVRAVGREIIREEGMGMAATKMYDVFLSFRGEDCRAKFIAHLYSSLQNSGLYVFKDDDGIQRGDKISVALMEAVGQSKISIVVLSRNFANSKWCMIELERIVEISRTKGMVVVPVFYEVDPSEVRHQTGEFGKAFEYLLSTKSVDEYTKRNWKTALHEVGGIAGFVILKSSDESEDIKKIVDLVTHLLDKTELFVADHPVGLESRVQEVIQLLYSQKSKDPLLLGIWGMGGIGKTTLAKAVYNKIRHDFDAKSFLFNVRDVWKVDDDKVSLQQRLLFDICKTTKLKIDSVELGKKILQERLCSKKILLVIDDVNKLDQLNALCGDRKWFGKGSRILITTRDADLLSRLEVDHVYRMKEMDSSESLELFNWHAFKQSTSREGFTNISRDVVKYSGGLPLALQVIGSFLSTKKIKAEWKNVLEKLKLIPNNEVLEKLDNTQNTLSK